MLQLASVTLDSFQILMQHKDAPDVLKILIVTQGNLAMQICVPPHVFRTATVLTMKHVIQAQILVLKLFAHTPWTGQQLDNAVQMPYVQ